MKKFMNIVWFILVGLWTSIVISIGGILFTITGVGSELGQQLFRVASYMIAPFDKSYDTNFSYKKAANIIWILLFGWWLSILYIAVGLFLICTLIGIPFGLNCFKHLPLIVTPFGSTV